MKQFNGRVLFLDRSDINTDEIIPAKYLTENSREALRPYLLEDLKLEGFTHPGDIADRGVIITRENFGCGSSREHAPWALEVNGINLVIAENFARIFRQNMYNCGMLAVELPKETISMLFDNFSQTETEVSVDLGSQQFTFRSKAGKEISVDFSLAEFDKKLITSGGWVEFADTQYHV